MDALVADLLECLAKIRIIFFFYRKNYSSNKPPGLDYSLKSSAKSIHTRQTPNKLNYF